MYVEDGLWKSRRIKTELSEEESSFLFVGRKRKKEKARKERVSIQGLDFIKGLSCSGLEKL